MSLRFLRASVFGLFFFGANLRAEVAQVRLSSLSLLLQPAELTGGGPPARFVVGQFDVGLPFPETAANNELRPGSASGYLGAFAIVRAGVSVEVGTIDLRGTFTDANQDLLPDHLELPRAASLVMTGQSQSLQPGQPDAPAIVSSYNVSGTFHRAAGDLNGHYTLSFTRADGSVAFLATGMWSLFTFDPARSRFIYHRTILDNTYALELTRFDDNVTFTSTMPRYVIHDGDRLTLYLIDIRDPEGREMRSGPSELQRSGNRYRGRVTFSPPPFFVGEAPSPPWRGFTDWVIEITDLNDDDDNGVPELTDPFRFSTSISINRGGTPLSVTTGSRFMLNTTVGGRTARYQWFRDGLPILGATSRTLTIDPVQRTGPTSRTTFTVLATSNTGAVASDNFNLELNLPGPLPTPARSIPAGALITTSDPFNPLLVGPNPITFLTNLPEAVHFVFSALPASSSAGAELTLLWRADFALPPARAGVALRLVTVGGGTVEFQLVDAVEGVLATARDGLFNELTIDDDGFRIRVSQNGRVFLSGATTTRRGGSLGLLGAPTATAPQFTGYRSLGVTAWPASWLLPRSTARLINLSTQGRVGTGATALAAGVVLSTPSPRPLLVRAVGPGLQSFGVADATSETALVVFQSGTSIGRNTAWDTAANSSEIIATTARVGGFSLTPGSRDSAYLHSFTSGLFTFEVSGTGSGLVEIYDAGTAIDNSRFVNLSTRGYVAAGRPMIAGFVITGEGTRTFLIRAIGAGLARFGVNGTLADPKLSLYDGASRSIFETDNWTTLNTISPVESIGSRVGAFALSSATDFKDAVFYVRLPAGNYTAHVTTGDGTGGIALLEIYDVVDP